SLFTRTLIFLQAYVVVCVVLSVVVFASAVRSRAEGLGLYAGGFLFVAVGGVHDIAVLQGLIISPFYWGPIGAFLFLLAQAVILAQRSARSLSTVEEQRRKLLELVERLRREQRERKRYEELSLAASGVAHETKNPLGIIRGLAQRLTTAPNVDQSTKVRAAQILDQADRAASRLGDFLNYARVRDPQISPVELDVVVGYAFEVLAPDLEAKELRSRIETGGAVVLADEEMVLQILLNLMLNSIAACEPGASLDLLFEGSEASTSTGTISVIDTGAGIPEDLLGRVRDPYVTGRADGHGLGLALVERLAELHGWALHISSRVGEGTRVEIEGVELAQDDAATEDTGRVSGS
ncbi:MAG: HAMP domain-containing sensor histidine kinase, partial [Acidobacteriota bacterium]